MTSTTNPTISRNSQETLKHLKKIKPLDGWSVQLKGSEVRLLRRGVALTDNYFRDLYVEPAGRVVGMLTEATKRGQVLVDPDGKPTGRTLQIITVASWTKSGPSSSSSSLGTATTANASSTSTSGTTTRNRRTTTTAASQQVSDDENRQILFHAICAVAGAVLLKFVVNALFLVYILVFPLALVYAMQTCPSMDSFDAKKELKRVMRGHHLPEDHPNKPKGWLNETMARVQATVATEVATGLSGYEVSAHNLLGAAIIAKVYVPSVQTTYVWLGVLEKWRFVYGYETSPADAAAAAANSSS